MTSNDMRGTTTLPAAVPIPDQVSAYLTAVYGWMCTGLAITAATAWLIARSPALVSAIAANRVVFWGLMIAQLGIVFVLSARVQRLAASTASLLFVLYSALTGVTISFVLLVFTGESGLGAPAGSAAGGLLFDVAPLPHASFLLVTVLTVLGVLLSLGLPNQLVVRKRGGVGETRSAGAT